MSDNREPQNTGVPDQRYNEDWVDEKGYISSCYDDGCVCMGANVLKFFLMPLVCITAFGLPFGMIGTVVSVMSGFVIPVFFILTGFFVLGSERETRLQKLKRGMGRSGLIFLCMFIAFFAFNVIISYLNGVDWVSLVTQPRTLFAFFVLNLWPFEMGESIWFIQSLFYAYVLLWLLDKIKLLRIYKLLLVLTFVFMIVSGELSGVINVNIQGYTFLTGNFLTRALPYMLIGMLIREYAEVILAARSWVYVVLAFSGLGLAALEYEVLYYSGVLTYQGHVFGFAVTAIGLSCLALAFPLTNGTFPAIHGRGTARRIYILCCPVAYALQFTISRLGEKAVELMMPYLSILVYLVCLLIAYLVGTVKFFLWDRFAPDDDDFFD